MNEIDVIRSVNFDWAMRISDVWSDSAWDTPELHANVRSEFARKLEVMRRTRRGDRRWAGSLLAAVGPAKLTCSGRSDVRRPGAGVHLCLLI